jgi:hypothetical protein
MPSKRNVFAAILAASFIVGYLGFAPPLAQAETVTCPITPSPRTLWVAPSGSDFMANGWTPQPNSMSTPWKTLTTSIHRLCAGDTLYVRGGTYREDAGWGTHPGTKTFPIRVFAYGQERVVLMGTLTLHSPNYWNFSGINVTRDPAAPRRQALVLINAGVYWRFTNAEIWGSNGVSNLMINSSVAGQPSHYVISGNCIHDNVATGDPLMNDHNIYLMPGYKSGPGIISHNIIFNAPNGGNIKAAGGNSSTGAAYVTIRYNTIIRGGSGVSVSYGSHHISLVRNLIGAKAGTASAWNGAMFGSHVTGVADYAGYSGVWGYAHAISNTSDSTTGIVNTGHIVWVHPVFDSTTSCSGFHPTDAASKAYGRYA